ncbi:hypothetical protein QQS21_000629 [Conoideocrella luteorostrata]|uniref:Heterokaryon incompatibility domain-containing protein n=1 Tax=Conoideocrella luteorostrata TaxID=1105319 RepID=A0AAJ0G3W1_9HYPO|nr:hypothetical protein QQS21_000629 [Conoideocrella luteorostrata]
MDHFETFDPAAEPFRGYYGFPERKGWRNATSNDGIDFQSHPQEDVDEFLQSWLYVGLLSEWTTILGLSLAIEHFIKSDLPPSNKRWITTKHLPRYFKAWLERETYLSELYGEIEYKQIKQLRIDRLRQLLQSVHAWTDALSRRNLDLGKPTQILTAEDSSSACAQRRLLSSDFATAVYALRFSIAAVAKQMWRLAFPVIDPGFSGREVFCARLLNHGWCPHDVRYLGTTVSMDACYYVCSYYPARALRDHGACDETHCKADIYNDSEGYHFRHTNEIEDCDCALQGPKLEDILMGFRANDGFPLIMLKNLGEAHWEMEVVPFDPAEPVDYVAFSHVWADGLGNPTDNALPTCQYPHLQQMANAAVTRAQDNNHSEPTPFWIDSLCIPVGEAFVEYRKLAIQRMRSTYQRAKSVLVLDKEILSGSKDARPMERVVRVVLSTWMRRLWTFQEGFLAQDLLFQFRDGPCHLDDLWQEEPHSLWSTGGRMLAGLFKVPMSLAKTDPDPQRIFISTLSNLQWRNTSRAGDETLCIAVILGFDTLPLLEVVSRDDFVTSRDTRALSETRMQVLLRLIKRFAPGIMFSSGNRLTQDGFKWAPASLLGQNSDDARNYSLQDFYIASLHHQRGTPGIELPSLAELADCGGIKVTMLGIMLQKTTPGKMERCFEIIHISPGGPAKVYEVCIIDVGEAFENAVGRDGVAMAIILDRRVLAHRVKEECSRAYGALVSIRRETETETEYTEVDFICRVIVQAIEVLDLVNGKLVMKRKDLNRPLMFLTDDIMQSERKWHIF